MSITVYVFYKQFLLKISLYPLFFVTVLSYCSCYNEATVKEKTKKH